MGKRLAVFQNKLFFWSTVLWLKMQKYDFFLRKKALNEVFFNQI